MIFRQTKYDQKCSNNMMTLKKIKSQKPTQLYLQMVRICPFLQDISSGKKHQSATNPNISPFHPFTSGGGNIITVVWERMNTFELAHQKRDPIGFQFVVLPMHIRSPLFGLQTCVFCLKLPQHLYYMSVNSKDWWDSTYTKACLSLCWSPMW